MENRKQDVHFEGDSQPIPLQKPSDHHIPGTGRSKKPALRLCTIYTRDILQFLPREEVGALQQVSSAMDEAVVGANSSQLPRRQNRSLELMRVGLLLAESWTKIHSLQFQYAHADVVRGLCQTEDGLANYVVTGYYGLGFRLFHTLPEVSECCRDTLQPLSERLVGRSLFPSCLSPEVFTFRVAIRPDPSSKTFDDIHMSSGVGIGLENRLTSRTAFALLHFLYHASRLSFDVARFEMAFSHDEWVMDPVIAALLSKPDFRLRARCVEKDRNYLRTGPPSTSRKAVSQLVECGRIFLADVRGVVPQTLSLAASGRRLAKKLSMLASGDDFEDCVDQLVNVSS